MHGGVKNRGASLLAECIFEGALKYFYRLFARALSKFQFVRRNIVSIIEYSYLRDNRAIRIEYS